jgi:dihydrolipoamide dehydrogenase
MSQEFDLVVIGAGPGGYVGAIRAAQLGMKVAVVEKDKTFGGTCLNVGCIPSKALLDSSEYYSMALHEFETHGIKTKGVELDLPVMLKRKEKVVADLTGGIAGLFKKNKITSFQGHGKLTSPTDVSVKKADGSTESLKARFVMLATGSTVNTLPSIKMDGKFVISSTEALCLEKVPKTMIVIGAGAIGLEMGSVWSRLGSEVTVVEYADKICGPMDKELSDRLMRILQKQKIKFVLGAQVKSATPNKNQVTVDYDVLADKSSAQLTADVCLVAVGRKPYSENLGLEELGIEKDQRGFVKVNHHFQTKYENVFAVGDLIPGPMLAHKAEEEGVAVAELIAGQAAHVNYDTLPAVVYTWPEFAAVGKTEEELKKAGTAYKVGKFLFVANGRARAANQTDGMVKVLANKTTDQLLGVHIVGPRASDILGEAVAIMEFRGSAEDLARTFHAHPTFSEAVREAALGCDGRVRQS